MAYAYWKSGKTEDSSVFDLYFRKNPFEGEFTIFAGLDECLKFIDNFRYSSEDIEYLRETLPEGIEDEFFEYLSQLTAKDVTLYAIEEGSVAFPRFVSCIFLHIVQKNTYSFNCSTQCTNHKSGRSPDHCTNIGNNIANTCQLCKVPIIIIAIF